MWINKRKDFWIMNISKITKLRKQTEQEALKILALYHKCAIVRPTGFGKTGILTKILMKYKKVLFLYPNDIIRRTAINFYNDFSNQSLDTIPNTTFMTYNRLLNLTDEDYEKMEGVDLIITDECHRLGAEKTRVAMLRLLEAFPAADLLGATATPERMDLIDEICMFFDNHVVSKYTLHDAFQDKILKKPYYCFCSYTSDNIDELKHELRLEVDKSDSLTDRENLQALLDSRLIEISTLTRMDNVIKTTCEKYLDSVSISNMKFIVFCSSFSHLHDVKNNVSEWFSKAFPTHTVSTLIVTSEKEEYRNNLDNLSNNSGKANHIELIMCCDMLNMGYHVGDITGILMYRGTSSGIVFSQQLGRVLSSGDTSSKIIFDIVDNLHRESVYDSIKHQSVLRNTRQKKYDTLMAKIESGIELTSDEVAEFNLLKKQLNSTSGGNWWSNMNVLEPCDLIATGHMATYRELIAKTVAEPIAMRSRQAWARWIEKGGDPMDMKAVSILSQKEPDAVPLAPFCRLKQVTIKNVLDTMGVKNEE